MSPILPTWENFPSTLKEGQITARILSGFENLNLASSNQAIKAQVTAISNNRNIVFSVNDSKITAKITSQLPRILTIGMPVILSLNSNHTGLTIQMMEPDPKIKPIAKNKLTSEKTFSLPRLRQGLVVEASVITKPSNARLMLKDFGNPQPNAKQLPTLPNIFTEFFKKDDRVRAPKLAVSKEGTRLPPPMINFPKTINNKKGPNTFLPSTDNSTKKMIAPRNSNYIKKVNAIQNTENSKINSSNLFLKSNTHTNPQTSDNNFQHNAKNSIRHIININNSTKQIKKSLPVVFLQSKPIENTKQNKNKSNIQSPHQKKHEENATNKSSPKTGNPIPNSLNQLYPKNTAQYSTNYNGIKHAITTFLEKIRSGTNRIQYPGINTDIAPAKKNVDVRIIKLLSPNSSPSTTKIANKDTIFIGTVIGKTPNGKVILDTPEKLMTLSGTTDLPSRAKILIEPLPVRINKNIIPKRLTIGQLINGWVRLETFISDLNIKSPNKAINFTNNQIGKPGLKLTATMAIFIAAIRMGNPSLWLGHENRNIINRTQSSLIRGLDDDFLLMQRASEPSDSGWRAFFFPMLSDEQLSQIQLFIHQDKNSPDKDKNSSRKTRFIVNLKLDNIGELQIDGRVNSVMVDLLVQTIKPLPLKLKKGIRDVFKNTLERTEIDGNIVFKVRKILDPLPINQLNGFSETSPSITDI
ncbi:hypothetical protein OAN59_09725 [Alphaproteobacteria bacterium]|nr:hypothetical protein [Alphaproteobacteria bacterium]